MELERSLKGVGAGFSPSFSERGRYYQNLVVSGAFEQLSRIVDSDLAEYGENDILTRVYWIHARHVLGTFPGGMLGLALDRVIRQINDLLDTKAGSDGRSHRAAEMDGDIKAAATALATLVPLMVKSLSDSPELSASIQGAWNELDRTIKQEKAGSSLTDEELSPQRKQQGAGQTFSHVSSHAREWWNRDVIHGFCKGLFLLLSPLLIYALWSQSRPGGVGSQVLNWIQGQEPLIRMDLLGPTDEVWLPHDGSRRWKELEEQKVSLILPVLARVDKLEGLQQISYSLEGNSAADGIGTAAPVPKDNAHLVSAQKDQSNTAVAESSRNNQVDGDVVSSARNQVVPAALIPAAQGKSAGLDVVDTSGPVEPEVVEPELEPAQTPGYGGEFPRERYFVTRGRTDERGKGAKGSFEASGDYYEIRVPTFIFEHPSFSSYRIAQLEVGDEVLGKESIGRWIKVVSYKGGVGFLPVNDARRAYGR
jgi:hypothetical protein